MALAALHKAMSENVKMFGSLADMNGAIKS
jgi:hypothetical protein